MSAEPTEDANSLDEDFAYAMSILEELEAFPDQFAAACKAVAEAELAVAQTFGGSAAREPTMDEPLKLEEAVCLPELGGTLTQDFSYSVPSRTVTVKGLRAAIGRGAIKIVPLNSKNFYVTRRSIQDWIAPCHEPQSLPISSGSSPNTTKKPGSSSRMATGQSNTARSSLAQASALTLVNSLKAKG